MARWRIQVILGAARRHPLPALGADAASRVFPESATGRGISFGRSAAEDRALEEVVAERVLGVHPLGEVPKFRELRVERRELGRPELLASHITQRQAALANGLIWEHYHVDWSVDWDYNRYDKSDIFRPWGYQPGHMTEWAKLLLILERHRPAPWLLPRAEQLFSAAFKYAWDQENGGLYYGFGLENEICDSDKYFWVQAESIATAALLAQRTAKTAYWDDYQRLWAYVWQHFVDHQHGAWWRILRADNQKYSDEKSPAGKVDYHTMGACYEVLNVLNKQ